MPGLRLIFGSIAMILAVYGLLVASEANASPRVDRYDQPPNVQSLIARAYSDPAPDDQKQIAVQLEQEIFASLREPDYFK